MELEYILVTSNDTKYIDEIYKILKESGEYLSAEKKLNHWKKPYPKFAIKNDTADNKVFLVKDIKNQEYINTFQLKPIRLNGKLAYEINKFATKPSFMGLGIGTDSLYFIEDHSIKNNVYTLFLDVYNKSLDAINFYKAKGFLKIKQKKTSNFIVDVMKKELI